MATPGTRSPPRWPPAPSRHNSATGLTPRSPTPGGHTTSSFSPTTCPRQWQAQAFLDRCHPAAGEAAGPGGAPAAKRGRTTWRRGEATATLGREEGPTGSRTRPRSHDCKENPGNRLTPTAKRTRYGARPCGVAWLAAPHRSGVICAPDCVAGDPADDLVVAVSVLSDGQ